MKNFDNIHNIFYNNSNNSSDFDKIQKNVLKFLNSDLNKNNYIFYTNDFTLDILNISQKNIENSHISKNILKTDDPTNFICPNCKDLNLDLYSYKINDEVKFINNQNISSISNNVNSNNSNNSNNFNNSNIAIQEKTQILKNPVLDNILLYCAKILLTNYDLDEAFNTLLKDLCEFHNAERTYIFSVDSVTDIVSYSYEFCAENVDICLGMIEPTKKSSLQVWFDYFDKKEYIFERFTKDLTDPKDKYEHDLLKDQNIDNILIICLHKNNKLIGFLGMDNPKKNIDNINLLQTISAFVVNNLYKFKLTKNLENKIHEFEEASELNKAMLECATTLLDDLNSKTTITRLLKTICRYYGAKSTCMIEFDNLDNLDNFNNLDNLDNYIKNTYIFNNFNNFNNSSSINNIKNLTNIMLTNINPDWISLFKNYEIIDAEIIKNISSYNFNNFNNLIIKPLIQHDNIIGFICIEDLALYKGKYQLLTSVSAFTINHIQSKNIVNKLQELSSKDILTGAFNRNYYLSTINRLKNLPPQKLGIVFADVNSLKVINDCLGHEYGDILIKVACAFLKEAFKEIENTQIFRIGGDEFVCILENIPEDIFLECIIKLNNILEKTNSVNVSIGTKWKIYEINIEEQISQADVLMYNNKKNFYKDNPKSKLDLKTIKNELDKINAKYIIL